jgi:hypothetical protein
VALVVRTERRGVGEGQILVAYPLNPLTSSEPWPLMMEAPRGKMRSSTSSWRLVRLAKPRSPNRSLPLRCTISLDEEVGTAETGVNAERHDRAARASDIGPCNRKSILRMICVDQQHVDGGLTPNNQMGDRQTGFIHDSQISTTRPSYPIRTRRADIEVKSRSWCRIALRSGEVWLFFWSAKALIPYHPYPDITSRGAKAAYMSI